MGGSLQPKIVVAIVAATGLALRVWTFTTRLGVMDADEAVVGLMARDWLDGQPAIFYWGQNYSGSHESLLVALVYAIGPADATIAKVVPVALHAAAAVLVWRIGRRVVDGRAALLAAGLVWVWPGAFVWWSLKTRGHYGSTLVLGLAAVLLALQLADDDLTLRRRRVIAAAFGLAAGLGWWASFHSVLLVVPAAVWLLIRRGRSIATEAPGAALGALVGALPWLVWNITNSFDSFRRPPVVATAPPYWERVGLFVTDAFPKAVGATVPFSGDWAVPVGGQLLLAAVVLAVATAAVAAVRNRDANLGLVVAIVVTYSPLLAVSPFFYVDEPRYLYYLSPIAALLIARSVTAITSTWLAAGAALIIASVFSATTLQTMVAGQMGLFTTGGVPVPRHLEGLVEALEDRAIRHVFAPYAMAYRITLESDGAVLATPIEHVRDPQLNEAVRSAPRPAWVFMAGSDLDRVFERAASARGIAPRCTTIEEFVICQPDRRLLQEDLPELQP